MTLREKIEAAAKGEFVTEITVRAPGEAALPHREVALVSSNQKQSNHQRKALVRIAGQPFELVLASKEQQLMDLRTTADWVVRPRLLKIPGVAEVFIQGGERKQYQILVNPAALLEYDVTLQQVEEALAKSNINTSGGFAVTDEPEDGKETRQR